MPASRSTLGAWMKVNSEAIYATTAGPFKKMPINGRCTQKPGKLYLHVFDWPAASALTVPGYTSRVTRAYLMADPGTPLSTNTAAEGLTINVPKAAPDPIATVIVLEVGR